MCRKLQQAYVCAIACLSPFLSRESIRDQVSYVQNSLECSLHDWLSMNRSIYWKIDSLFKESFQAFIRRREDRLSTLRASRHSWWKIDSLHRELPSISCREDRLSWVRASKESLEDRLSFESFQRDSQKRKEFLLAVRECSTFSQLETETEWIDWDGLLPPFCACKDSPLVIKIFSLWGGTSPSSGPQWCVDSLFSVFGELSFIYLISMLPHLWQWYQSKVIILFIKRLTTLGRP